MNTHSIELDGYYARSRGNSTIYLGTAGSHGNEQLQVTQGKGWEGLTVQVVFHPSKVAVQLPANGLLDVPWEATAQPLTMMQGRIVFQGFDQDRLVNSTDLAYTVASHSPALGRDEEPYTPGIVEGVLNQMAADKDAILQAAQQTGQAKEAAAASANQAAGSAAKAQQSAGAANTSAGQAAASASQAAGSAAAAGETLTQVQTAGQEAQQKVKDAETEALDKIAAAAPALPAVSADTAWQSVTVKPDGTGYNLAALAPIEATIRPTVTGNPAVCENSVAWGLQGLKIYGKSVQNGIPSPEHLAPIVSMGETGSVNISINTKNLNNGVLVPIVGSSSGNIVSNLTNQSVVIPIKGGLTYTISVSEAVVIFECTTAEYPEAGTPIVDAYAGSSGIPVLTKTRATSSNAKYLVINIAGNYEILQKAQVEIGSVATAYVPYQSQTLTISTPNGLPGIPVNSGGNYTDESGQQQVCDVVDFGTANRTTVLKEVAFSDLSWEKHPLSGTTSSRFVTTDLVDAQMSTNPSVLFAAMSNMFTAINGNNLYNTEVSAMSGYNEIGNKLFVKIVGVTELSDFLEKTKDATLLYQLSNPITTPLSPEELAAYRSLTTYPETSVVSTAEPVAGLEVQYIADGTKYAEKVQSMESRLAALEAAQTGI